MDPWFPIIDAEIMNLRAQVDIVCECGTIHRRVYVTEHRPFQCDECGRLYRLVAVVECDDTVPRRAATGEYHESPLRDDDYDPPGDAPGYNLPHYS